MACPAIVDDLGKFFRDVDAPNIVPLILEPFLQFVAGVVVEYIDVQLTLLTQSCESEVAAAHESDGGIIWIGAVDEVQLCVKCVAQKQLNENLLSL